MPQTTLRPTGKLRRSWAQFSTGSLSRKILSAATTIAVLTSFAKLASVAKELLVARRFGTSSTIEAHLVAFIVPALAMNVISASLAVALIPTYVATRDRHGKEAAQQLLSNVTIWSLLLLGATAIFVVATSHFYLPLIASGFDQRRLSLAYQLLVVVSPIVVLSGIGNIWGAVLNAGERFALVALAPVITPSITIVVLLISRHTIFALPIGMVIGAGVEMAILGIALKLRGISLRPRWHGFNSDLREVASQFFPRLGASLLRSGGAVIDRSFAAMLGPGNVAALSYGGRISGTLLSVAGLALGSAITPYYSAMAAQNDWLGLRRIIKRYGLVIILASIPLVAMLMLFATPIVRFVFERGSFLERDTLVVSQVQLYYALQIPFLLGSILLGRFLGSAMSSHVLIWAAVINVSLTVILNYLFIQVMGVSGIALAASCASAVTFCFLLVYSIKILRAKSREVAGEQQRNASTVEISR